MTKYKKTPEDKAREAADLATSPIMRFLKNRQHYVFNVGDILIKETRWGKDKPWTPVKTPIGGMKKYMYVFENELGIGYIKQLRVDGTGLTTNLTCVANYDPETVRLLLDPDYADHLLIGEGKFNYNEDYMRRKEFRQEAMKKNKGLLINTRKDKYLTPWFHSLKRGDIFWASHKFDDLSEQKYQIVDIIENNAFPCPNHEPIIPIASPGSWLSMPHKCTRALIIKCKDAHKNGQVDITWFANRYTTTSRPYPLEDKL